MSSENNEGGFWDRVVDFFTRENEANNTPSGISGNIISSCPGGPTTVTVTNTDTGKTVNVPISQDGSYSVSLQPGNYKISWLPSPIAMYPIEIPFTVLAGQMNRYNVKMD